MKLISITLTKLPGIENRLHIEGFTGGVNFVTGPNASGKSSIIRALHFLLKPREKTDPNDLILEAEFELDGSLWQVTRTAHDPVWRRAGEVQDPPNLPPADALDCHLIRIEDLLSVEKGNDAQLAEALRVEMDGGFNLQKLRQLALDQAKITARTEKAWVEKSNQNRLLVQNEHRALARQQQTLPELDKAIEQAEQASAKTNAIHIALEALELQHDHQALQARRMGLPQVLGELTGQELQKLDDLEKMQKKWRATQLGLQHNLDDQRAHLESSGFERQPPDRDAIATAKAYAQTLATLHHQITSTRKRLHVTEQRMNEESMRLDPHGTNPPKLWPKLTVEDLDAAQALARKIDQAHRFSLAPSDQPASGAATSWGVAILASVIGLLGLLLGQAWVSMAALGAIVFQATWNILAGKRRPTPTKAPISREQQALEEEARTLATRLGFQPALMSEHAGLAFGDAYRQFEKARDEQIEYAASLAHDQQRWQETADKLHALWKKWGWQPAAEPSLVDQDALQVMCADWIERAESAHQLVDAMAQTERQLDQAQQELTSIWQGIEKIYEAAKLDGGERAQLVAILDQLPIWHQIETEMAKQRALIDDRLQRLAEQPELLSLVDRQDQMELQAKLRQYQTSADKLNDLRDQRTRLLRDIEKTTQGNRLQQANAEYEQAVEALRRKQNEVFVAEATLFWLHNLEQQNKATGRDRAFDYARELFSSFTHHQWEMQLGDSLMAIRTSDQAPVALSELSTATRMQLLLSARIARVMQLENQSERLPLFIDEALTTSDPNRAATIIENLQNLAKQQDRQIIYLAASDYELQLWEHLHQQKPTRITLPARPSPNDDETLSLEFKPETPLPNPSGQSPEAYAKMLGIGHWVAHRSIDDLSIFYLMADELDLMHQFMSGYRIHALGPLERWLQSPAAVKTLPEAQRTKLQTRCQLARRWLSMWHRGRAIPLTEGSLSEAMNGGGLTEITLPGVMKMAKTVDFDGARLLAMLKDQPIETAKSKKRLSQPKWEEFAAFLLDRGHVCNQTIASPDQLREHALAAISHETTSNELKNLQALMDRLEQGQPPSPNL